MNLGDQSWQTVAIIPRRLPRILRQDHLPVDTNPYQPLQPVSPRQRLLRVVMHPAHKEGTHCTLRQTGCIDG
jgi:hypothetical protein